MRTDLDGAVMVDAARDRMTVRTFRARPGDSIHLVP
jgi:hypothetical protein